LPQSIQDKYVFQKGKKPQTRRTETQKDWKDISWEFTEKLVEEWLSYGFDFNKAHEWINNVGLSVKDAEYASWLEKEVDYTPLKYLNKTSAEEQQGLREQFAEYKADEDKEM
jgi:hypothetical protein